MGLGYLGLGQTAKAADFPGKVLELDVNHQSAQVHPDKLSVSGPAS
ncbi:MAG: hypothetical protein LBC19_00695 [Tannerella sp.]|jgi:hypothetical protein|nr:hypothetical protein [Tannerella sp.]